MRAQEFTKVVSESSIEGSLQLYVPRPKQVEEIFKPGKSAGKTIWTSTAKMQDGKYTSAWVEWCKSEMPQWLHETGTLYKVKPGAKILSLNTDSDAYRIGKQYGLEPPTDNIESFEWARSFPWDKVAKDFAGIHHVPTKRFENMLMSMWDVESTVWFDITDLENLGEVEIDL